MIEGRGLGGLTQAPPRKPLIAAVEGWALAGGFELSLACDLVVAAETARFGVPEVKRALVAGAGAAVLLPQPDPAGARAGAAAHRRPDQRRAGRRDRPGQPVRARGRRPGRGARAGRHDRRQRTAGGRGHQADRHLRPGLDAGTRAGPPGRADAARVRLRGRHRGRDRLRREARPGLEGPLRSVGPVGLEPTATGLKLGSHHVRPCRAGSGSTPLVGARNRSSGRLAPDRGGRVATA